jgi:hypothetical protein
MAKDTEPKNVKPKAYTPPTVKQIMRWQVSPAAKAVAYFIRLNRDKQTGWRHAPMKDLREEVGPATTYEQVESALKELAMIGALEADPKLGVQLSSKEKRKGRSYRLHRPGRHAYKVKPKTTRRVTKATRGPKLLPKPTPPAQSKILDINAQGEPLPSKKILRIDPETGESIHELTP